MEKEFWIDKWKENKIGFHESEVNKHLKDHFSKYLQKNNKPNVLVPLCGKSLDLLWLHHLSHKVIGIELSEKAILDFFTENNLLFSVREENDYLVYTSMNFKIYCGNIFDIPKEKFHEVDYIYDRASLVALPEETRENLYIFYKYLIQFGATLFTVLFDYDQIKMEGPPFAITESEVNSKFVDFKVDHLMSEKYNFEKDEKKFDFYHKSFEINKRRN